MILFMASLNFCHSTGQKGSAMYSNSKIKFYWFAAIFGFGLMLITLGTASAQQPLRPELILDVGNSHFDVFSKASPPALVKSVTLATFFNYTVETLFDPRVVYDQTWQRWIVTADAFPESAIVQRLFIGVSKTSDPTGPFFIYNIDVDFFDNNDFYDFLQLGIDQDAVLFTANIFPAAGGFSGADFFSIAKARLYNGLSFSVPIFTRLAATLAPPIVLDQNASTFLIAAPPSGTTLTKFTATNTSHPGSTRLVPSTVTVPSYTVPPHARQSGNSQVVDTSDSSFVNGE